MSSFYVSVVKVLRIRRHFAVVNVHGVVDAVAHKMLGGIGCAKEAFVHDFLVAALITRQYPVGQIPQRRPCAYADTDTRKKVAARFLQNIAPAVVGACAAESAQRMAESENQSNATAASRARKDDISNTSACIL